MTTPVDSRIADQRLGELIDIAMCRRADGTDWRADMAVALRELKQARAELHQYRLSPQLGCSVDAEVWHQLRMKMDAALGPDFDPYVRGECFAALDAIVKQRDDARAALTAREREVRYLRHFGNKDCTAMADEMMADYVLERNDASR